ncbi:MAG TPA: hypothetical protein VL283_04725 [Candidatus Baltobacteraceae bacterium]|nr:hypothetical protein [Candidatus Baltobacteraceae bacterium]
MKKIILIAIVTLTGCYGAQISELRRQNGQLADENARFRKDYAKRQAGQGTETPPAEPTTQVTGGASTSVMLARQPHGPYNGTIGAQPRQMTMGPKLRFDNHVCVGSSREFTCKDKDRVGGPDYNYYLAFVIDSVNPAAFPATWYVHPDTGEMLMPPDSTAFIELGESCIVNVTVKSYRDTGGIVGGVKVIKLSPSPSKTVTVRLDACDGDVYREITETFF